jgi:hypothetical protein
MGQATKTQFAVITGDLERSLNLIKQAHAFRVHGMRTR